MGSSKCDLYLENYTDHYSSGQTIVGHALCTFAEPKVVHGIFLKIKGTATTHWTESESTYNSTTKKNETRSISYNGSHQLISQEIDLLNRFGSETTIPAGTHKYPFVYRLPDNLPSTYKHSLGRIDYIIKAVVKRPLLKFNYEAETNFVVVSPVNLNNYPTFHNPQTRNKVKETYFCCWNKGSINVTANIPKGSFVIGESLPLHLQVENLSQTNVDAIKVQIRSVKEFTVTTPSHKSRLEKDTIFTDTYSGVGAHGENTYDTTIFINNASLISNYIDNNVISNSYELKITFVIAGMHTNIDFKIPILIGHIPFGVSPPMGPTATYGLTTHGSGMGDQPPAYGFVQPQPDFNSGMGMTLPPSYNKGTEGAFGGYPPAVVPVPGMPGPSALLPPTAPSMEASAPPKETQSKDNWEYFEDSKPQDLPTYDEAVRNERKM